MCDSRALEYFDRMLQNSALVISDFKLTYLLRFMGCMLMGIILVLICLLLRPHSPAVKVTEIRVLLYDCHMYDVCVCQCTCTLMSEQNQTGTLIVNTISQQQRGGEGC